MLERPVIRAFGFGRETTGRQFPRGQVILQTIAANGFPRTRFVAAIALLLVSFLFAIHISIPDSKFEIDNLESRIAN